MYHKHKKGRTYLVKKVNLEGNIERRLEMLGMTDQVKLMVLNKKKSRCCNYKRYVALVLP